MRAYLWESCLREIWNCCSSGLLCLLKKASEPYIWLSVCLRTVAGSCAAR